MAASQVCLRVRLASRAISPCVSRPTACTLNDFGTLKPLRLLVQVTTDDGVAGVLEGPFGKSGKFNVRFSADGVQPGTPLTLRFKKFVFGDKKHMAQ